MNLIPERARPAFVDLARVLARYGPVACETTSDPDAWWPTNGEVTERTAQATVSCRRCPAQPECLDYATAAGEDAGIWGATTPTERRQLLARSVDQEILR